MVQWELHSKHPTTSFGKIVSRHVGALDAQNVDSMISAYEALYKGKFKSANDIRRSFTKDGQPLFTSAQAESVFKKIRPTQTQNGGAPVESIVNMAARQGIDLAAGITEPGPPNPAVQATIKTVQMAIRMIIPFIFILDTLENTPLFGDLIGAALDVTAAVLPVIASNIQTITPGLVGLIPVPLAGTLGIVLGWLFSLFFLWLAMVIGISRKEFAAALEATAGMVPVIGPALSRGVKAVETVGTKFYNRADKISASISKAFGSLQAAVNNAKSTLGSIKVNSPTNLPSMAEIKNKVQASIPPPVPAAGEKPAPSAPPADENPTSPTPATSSSSPTPTPTPTLPAAVSSRKVFPPAKALGKKKGGRFTRRKRNTNRKKWPRTTTRRRR